MKLKNAFLISVIFLLARSSFAIDSQRLNLIATLHPTQAAVGQLAVEDKKKSLKGLSGSEMTKYLKKNPVPVVRGPNQEFYLVDHHHLTRALEELKYDNVYISVIDDFSNLNEIQFWNKMLDRNLVYLRDENGKEISPYYLPSQIKDMKDDIYRSLSYFVRESGGYEKTNELYAEFNWADFFRTRIPKYQLETNWKNTLNKAIKLAHCPEAKSLPGFRAGDCEKY